MSSNALSELADEQGWSPEALGGLALAFIASDNELEVAFWEFCADVAEEENSWCLDNKLGMEEKHE